MSEEIKKSVFVKEIKKYYPVFCVNETRSILNRLRYYHEAISETPYDPVINHEIIIEIDTPMPLLNKGDEFYFEDTKKSFSIKKVIRTNSGNVVYVIETEIVEDIEAKKQYEIDKNRFFEVDKYKDKIEKLENRGFLARIFNKKID